jgi:hypothetical protein
MSKRKLIARCRPSVTLQNRQFSGDFMPNIYIQGLPADSPLSIARGTKITGEICAAIADAPYRDKITIVNAYSVASTFANEAEQPFLQIAGTPATLREIETDLVRRLAPLGYGIEAWDIRWYSADDARKI